MPGLETTEEGGGGLVFFSRNLLFMLFLDPPSQLCSSVLSCNVLQCSPVSFKMWLAVLCCVVFCIVVYQQRQRSSVMHKRHQFRCNPAPPVHHIAVQIMVVMMMRRRRMRMMAMILVMIMLMHRKFYYSVPLRIWGWTLWAWWMWMKIMILCIMIIMAGIILIIKLF